MGAFTRPQMLNGENYEIQPAKKDTWRDRFKFVEAWAEAMPWDQIEQVPEAEIKLCINELFEAVNMNIEAFRFIEKRNGSTEALTCAKEVANILEGR